MAQNEIEKMMDSLCDPLIQNSKWLFERQDVEGVFPLFYLFYSYNKGLPTCLDKVRHADKDEDKLQEKLYNAALGVLGGDPADFSKLENIYQTMKDMGRDRFGNKYIGFLEGTLCRTSLVSGTAPLPNQIIATTIFKILRKKGCENVYVAYSGAGSYVVESRGITYRGAETSAQLNLIAEVLADAYGIESYSFINTDPLTDWPKEKYDAVIGNLPVDVDFFDTARADHFLTEFNNKQDAFIKALLKHSTATKVAALLVHFEFANKADYDETRKAICDRGMLDTVIAMSEDIFTQANVPTYIIILDMKGGRDSATFIDATHFRRGITRTISGNRVDMRFSSKGVRKIIDVSYDRMKDANWAFNPFVYMQGAFCPEGMELVRIGDVAEVVVGMAKKGQFIEPEHLSRSVKTVLEGISATKRKNAWGNPFTNYKPVPPNSILLGLSSGTRRTEQNLVCGMYKGDGPCCTDCFVSVLKPFTEKILPEYLALALLSDPSFAAYYKNIQQYYTDDIRASHLRQRRIPILTDMIEQRKVVEAAKGTADNEETIYNIVLAGTGNNAKDYSELLERVRCKVIRTTAYVEGEGGLEEILAHATKEGVALTKKVDAVVFSTDIRLSASGKEQPFYGLDAVIDLRLKYEPLGIVFYASSNVGDEEIAQVGIISPRRLKPLLDGHFFIIKGGLPDKALAMALRKELDTNNSPGARIRSANRDVFEAADWIDSAYEGGKVAEVLSDFLIARDFGKDSSRNLNELRIVAHHIIDILKQWNVVPNEPGLDHGAIPKLIYNRKYDCKATSTTYFYIDDTVMPRTLSSALVSLVEVGNTGSHTFNSDPQLGAGMLNSLMAFVVWIYNGKETLQNRKTQPWFKENKSESVQIGDMPITGPARKETVNGKEIWVCGNVHLQYNPALKEGDTVTINSIIPEKKFRTSEITGFAPANCYTIGGSDVE